MDAALDGALARMTEAEWKKLFCFRCGVQFAVLCVHFDQHQRHGEKIICPNGHENRYMRTERQEAEDTCMEDLEAARAEITRLKGELVTARHRAEMAEAKASPGDPVGDLPELPDPRPIVVVGEDGRIVCPVPGCGVTYKIYGSFRRHMRLDHKEQGFAEFPYDRNGVRFVRREAGQAKAG